MYAHNLHAPRTQQTPFFTLLILHFICLLPFWSILKKFFCFRSACRLRHLSLANVPDLSGGREKWRGPSSFGGFKIIDFLISFVWQKDFLRFGLLFFCFLWFFPLAVCVKATDNVEINIICPIWGCLMSRPEICLAQIENQNQF